MAKAKVSKTKTPDAVKANLDELTIPDFLKRAGPRMSHEDIKRMCGTLDGSQRVWAPIRSSAEIAARPKVTKPIFVTNDQAPVSVVVAGKGAKPSVLATYANMAEFTAQHDIKTYPVVREESNKELTLIYCSAKPWAGIIKSVPGIDEPTPPTKRTMRVAKGENIASRIIEMFPADGGSRKEIQTILEKDGMDKSMLDNSLGGRLDRLVREGKLTKTKEDKRVMYRLVGVAPVAAVPEVVVAVVKTTAGKAAAVGKSPATIAARKAQKLREEKPKTKKK